MKIQVLGTGCKKCDTLAKATDAVAKELGIDYELEKVTDIMKIMEAGVMTTPALVIDGEVKVTGRVPAADELKKLMQRNRN